VMLMTVAMVTLCLFAKARAYCWKRGLCTHLYPSQQQERYNRERGSWV